MAKKELTDKQIKAYILRKLKNRYCWGGKYKPLTSVVSWVDGKIKRNGKRARKLIDELVKERYLLAKKRGNTLSLNPKAKNKIYSLIKNN